MLHCLRRVSSELMEIPSLWGNQRDVLYPPSVHVLCASSCFFKVRLRVDACRPNCRRLITSDFNQLDKQCGWRISQSKEEWGVSNSKQANLPPGRKEDLAFRNVESSLSMTCFKSIWMFLYGETWNFWGWRPDVLMSVCVKCWPASQSVPHPIHSYMI